MTNSPKLRSVSSLINRSSTERLGVTLKVHTRPKDPEQSPRVFQADMDRPNDMQIAVLDSEDEKPAVLHLNRREAAALRDWITSALDYWTGHAD